MKKITIVSLTIIIIIIGLALAYLYFSRSKEVDTGIVQFEKSFTDHQAEVWAVPVPIRPCSFGG